MQFIIDARALKPFTRALACISKYGDEMTIHANMDGLVLSSLNLAKTAYCSFTYRRSFFQRYTAPRATQAGTAGPSRTLVHNDLAGEDARDLKCMLQSKPLLAILRHRNTEKSVEKCELTIIDGVETPDEELRKDEDSFESRLIVRLYCKHGIVKTHRLLLNTPTSDEAPLIPTSDDESRILVQARIMKEIMEYVPNSKGQKSDPELIWTFNEDDVRVGSMEKGIDAKGKSQLATEMTISADKFDSYIVPTAPLTLGFFLREFSATVALADALNISIDFRFTTSVQPICISADADACSMLFIIATNPARGVEPNQQQAQVRKVHDSGRGNVRSASGVAAPRKRAYEDVVDENNGAQSRTATPNMPHASARGQNGHDPEPMYSASAERDVDFGADADDTAGDHYDSGPPQSQPLFLASQLSQAEFKTIQEAGLGIENMDTEEFEALFDDDNGEEIERPGRAAASAESQVESRSNRDELEYDDQLDEDVEMGPTQLEPKFASSSDKPFHPLFED